MNPWFLDDIGFLGSRPGENDEFIADVVVQGLIEGTFAEVGESMFFFWG